MSHTHEFHRKLAPLFRAMGVDMSPEVDENAYVIGVDDQFDVLVHGSEEGVLVITAVLPTQIDSTQGAIATALLATNAPSASDSAWIAGLDEKGHPVIWLRKRLNDLDEDSVVELFEHLVDRVRSVMAFIDGCAGSSTQFISTP